MQQPTGLDEFAILSRVDPTKDVDGLHPLNLGCLVMSRPAPLPCTPVGIVELLRRYDVPIEGANVVVVGRGLTVGRPLGLLLTSKSENATVTLVHTAPGPGRARPVGRHRGRRGRRAGPGQRRTWSNPGAAVLDVGVSRENGKLVGDVDPACAEVAGWWPPTPAGWGR